MVINKKKFTTEGFLWCMNVSFVIGMSQLHDTILGNFIEIVALLGGLYFCAIHFTFSAQIKIKSFLQLILLIAIGLIALVFSRGATLLKLVLFFAITQNTDLNDILKSFMRSLIAPLVFVGGLSILGVLNLYYEGQKDAIEFGMSNPNTVSVIVFSILVAYNLINEDRINAKIITIEFIICAVLYSLCKTRTAGGILLGYLICIAIFKNRSWIIKVFRVFQYTFPIGAMVSYCVAVAFRSRTSFWIQVNTILSGRLWAWDLYLSKYKIKFFGQPIDLSVAALDNAYLRILIQYGVITFFVYLIVFVFISRYAYKKGKIILFFSIISYELYFMAEFGPILANCCPILLYAAHILVNEKQKELK